MRLLHVLRKFRRRYDPLVEVVIYRDRLLHNLQILRDKGGQNEIAPVLKSNAYGHGLVEVAEILDNQDLPFFVVDSYHEALVLRNVGIKTPILVIGFTPFENIKRNRRKDIAFTITDFEQLPLLAKSLKSPQAFHLKIDTGLHRQGILTDDTDGASAALRQNSNITLEGVCSHLADSAGEDEEFNNNQIAAWNNVLHKLETEFPNLKYYHLSASSGLRDLSKIKSNVARVGKALYGVSDVFSGLEPVLELRAKITGIKKLRAGQTVGYGMTFKAQKDMVVGSLPLGYFEGVDRRLSNRGVVKYKNKFCGILGLVSMNITVIDLTGIPEPKIGDEVVVISGLSNDSNSAVNIAKICNTAVYEILVHIPQHLRRVVR